MSDETVAEPGSIQFTDVVITNLKGEKVSILPLILELNVYESFRQPFVTADITLQDSLSLIPTFPIVGQEMVHIEFKTPTNAFLKKISLDLRIISVKEMSRVNARTSGYILKCVSVPMIRDINTKIRKAYSNMLISDMVKKISEEFLGVTSDMMVFVEETDGDRTFVIPNKSPTAAIEFLSREAKSTLSTSSNYIFYQNCDGFFFQTTDEMIDPKTPGRNRLKGKSIDKYYGDEFGYTKVVSQKELIRGSVRGGSSTKPAAFTRIKEFHYDNVSDYYKGALSGFVENSARFLDPLTSYYKETPYIYTKDHTSFRKTSQSQANLFLTESNDYAKNGESYITFQPTNFQQNNDIPVDQKMEFLHYKIGAANIFENLIASVTIPGDSEKRIGEVIDLEIPEYGATDDIEPKINKFLSGEYLILAVRHSYTMSGYDTIMTVAKNAYEKSIETPE